MSDPQTQQPPQTSEPPKIASNENPFTIAYCKEHKAFSVALTIYQGIALFFGISSLILVIQKDPALLPAATPCPLLTSGMTPVQYRMENGATGSGIDSHFISRVKPPTSTLDVVLQNRCFNGKSGSSLLLVNNVLAAFTRNDNTDIFDCHGKRLWKVEQDSQIKVYSDSGTYTLMSNIPYHGCNVIVYAQPSNQVVARIKLSSMSTLESASSEYDVTIENQLSPAADPGLLLMLYGKSFFTRMTEQTCPTTSRRLLEIGSSSSSDSGPNHIKDGCNAFAQGTGIGGILMFAILIFYWYACWWQARTSAKQQAAISSAPGHNEMQQLPPPGYPAAEHGPAGQPPHPAKYNEEGQPPSAHQQQLHNGQQ